MSTRTRTIPAAPLLLVALSIAAATSLSACIPLVVAGAGAAVMVGTDRRTTGTQVDDEVIEQKIGANLRERYKGEHHVIATSYDGIVLLTGQVPDQQSGREIAEMARSTPKVRSVQNELTVGPVADLSTRSSDSLITSKVKTRFVEASKFQINHVKVVTERGVVYLMGIVRNDEADAAVQIARTTNGVTRVVKVFEYFKG